MIGINYFFRIVALIKGGYYLVTPRIAIVIKALSEIETGANQFMQKRFLENAPFFGATYALEIHSLEKKAMIGFDINRWFRIKTARSPGGQDNILFVEIDINTQPENQRDYTEEDVRDLCLGSFEFANENFRNCFGVPL